MDELAVRIMTTQSEHPVRDSFLRFVLLLVWYGAGSLILGMLNFSLIIYAASLGERFAAALGGSLLAKAAGIIVFFVVYIAVICLFAFPLAFGWGAFNERWPDNPVSRLARWVKAAPPIYDDDDEW